MAAARNTAWEVADRLSDPLHVAEIAARAAANAPGDLMLPGWQPASLMLGHAGITLLHTRCARDEEQRAAIAHAHLSAAVASITRADQAIAGDVYLPAQLHAHTFGGYARLLSRSAEVHASYATAYTARLAARMAEQPGSGLSYADYDALAGLAGQGRTLLLAAQHGHEPAAEALNRVLDRLVALTRPVTVAGTVVPGWWCAPEQYVVPQDRNTFPRGDFNVGAAHGICGPLALLALAQRAGFAVPDTAEAVHRVTDWLMSWKHTDEWGGYWPSRIPYEQETTAARSSCPVPPARPGWCYGTAGVAGTLHLAARTLDEPTVAAHALDALRAAFHRPLTADVAEDPGFCHGRAGMLHAAVRIAEVTGDAELWAAATDEARTLIEAFDPRTPFGFQQLVRSGRGTVRLDAPGVVDGAAGTALALLTYADAYARTDPAHTAADAGQADWDAAFLMT
ncbi:lanthionine synthetase C family protein [Streptomyces violascens]|uniref:lanthionine synthetase C family protein n=1 Tax=Streptomyces violascens TaxID=67381 RepID=UPI0037A9C601